MRLTLISLKPVLGPSYQYVSFVLANAFAPSRRQAITHANDDLSYLRHMTPDYVAFL